GTRRGGATVVALDGQQALHTYLSAQLPGPFAAALRASRAFSLITAATPGLAELLTIGELKRLIDDVYDRVVFDAPATGHLLAMFDAPARFERAAAVGPIAARARQLGEWVTDPVMVSCVTVTTGDGLAVSELLDLIAELEEHTGHQPAMVIANRLAPHSPSPQDMGRLDARPEIEGEAGALDVVRRIAARARSERAQLGRVTKATGSAPVRVVEVPGSAVEAIRGALALEAS
ncbi:MAG: hypothetical protein JHD16_14545, partial [Solirubrobacteraceae bacterium]|nr:hypothetical protein [Solirubrobacteraceae bacterium]